MIELDHPYDGIWGSVLPLRRAVSNNMKLQTFARIIFRLQSIRLAPRARKN